MYAIAESSPDVVSPESHGLPLLVIWCLVFSSTATIPQPGRVARLAGRRSIQQRADVVGASNGTVCDHFENAHVH
jgi:hypothetical protein